MISLSKMSVLSIIKVIRSDGLNMPDSDARALLDFSLLRDIERRTIENSKKGMAINRSLMMVICCPLVLSLYENSVRNAM